MDRFWDKVDKHAPNGCWEWTGPLNGRYGQFRLNNETMVKPHRLVMFWQNKLTHWSIRVDSREVDHIYPSCSKACVNPAHLQVMTPEEHRAKTAACGEMTGPINPQYGTAHHASKLDEDKVRAIRQEYAAGGISQRQLAIRYGVSNLVINKVINNKSWKHVT